MSHQYADLEGGGRVFRAVIFNWIVDALQGGAILIPKLIEADTIEGLLLCAGNGREPIGYSTVTESRRKGYYLMECPQWQPAPENWEELLRTNALVSVRYDTTLANDSAFLLTLVG